MMEGEEKEKIEKRKQTIRSFEDLIVWQKAHRLMLDVYQLAKLLPREEEFNRKSQLRRSVSSVPANIAEGFGRYHYQENMQFCRQARGSLTETKSHTMAVRDLQQAPAERCLELIKQCDELFYILNGYITSTQRLQAQSRVKA